MFYPKLQQSDRSRRVMQTFLGLNRNPRPAEGALVETENLTAEGYPTLSPRKPRGIVTTLTNPQGLLGKEALAYVDGRQLYWNGLPIAGLTLSTQDGMTPKTLVSMGAYIVIFPDKMYVNTADLSDFGSLDNCRSVECTNDAGVKYSLCLADGTNCESVVLSAEAPEEPESGDLWMDTSAVPHCLKIYSADTGLWTEIPTVYVRLEGAGIGSGFSQYDGVTISGCGESSLNGAAILQEVGSDYVVITGLIDEAFTQLSGTVTIARAAPDIDYVTECGNRLWGCKYGLTGGKTVNEIYACALGDFKNWNKFQGLSTDSYTASRGSDGPWTGAVTHLGCPVFFKENTLEKVYPSSTGAHEIVTTVCRGVQAGSHKSLAIVGEILYYKSVTDICAYDGALPVSVSRALGETRYGNAVAGSVGGKYYISMADPTGAYQLLVYDTTRNLWHREDSLQITSFAAVGPTLYALDAGHRLLTMDGSYGQSEGSVSWYAETGPIGLERADEKVISRLSLRLELEPGADMDVYIRYDGEGDWRHEANLRGDGLGSRVIPILPHRCDHFALRLKGRGQCRVYSIRITTEDGSDTQWPSA